MYAIIVDHKSNAKLVPLSPLDGFATEYMTPCGVCGEAVLSELTVDCVCTECQPNSERKKQLENNGWMWEHPGYWRKNFGNRITVVAGTSEYRFDFTFCDDEHDLGYGPDLCVDIDEWSDRSLELRERGCFSLVEMEELELVYGYLYTDKQRGKVYGNEKWEADYGSLLQPNGMYLCGTEEAIHITKEMLFDDVGQDMTDEQSHIFRDFCAVIIAFLTSKIS